MKISRAWKVLGLVINAAVLAACGGNSTPPAAPGAAPSMEPGSGSASCGAKNNMAADAGTGSCGAKKGM